MVLDVISLGSSSKGNAYFLNVKRDGYDENETFGLLIECGLTYETMSSRLHKYSNGRFKMSDIKVVLITHRHLDHSREIEKMLTLDKRVFAPKEVFDYHEINVKDYPRNAFILEHGKQRTVADNVVVKPLLVKHDEVLNMIEARQRKGENITIDLDDEENKEIENLAYIITVNGNYDVLFMIDTMYNPYNLSGFKFDDIFMEANYFSTPTYFAYQDAKDNKHYGNIKRYERLLYSHMSVETAIKTLNGFDLSRTKRIFITHTSSSQRVRGYEMKYYTHIANKLKKKDNNARVFIMKENGGFHTGGI